MIDEVVAAAGLAAARLRVTVTGGVGLAGTGRSGSRPTLVVAAGPLDPWPAETTAVTVPWPRNEMAALAGVKVTSFAENVDALAEARKVDASEAILPNTRGNLCEGTGTNVFAVVDGVLVTPPLMAGCLPGVTRALVLEVVPEADEDDLPDAAPGRGRRGAAHVDHAATSSRCGCSTGARCPGVDGPWAQRADGRPGRPAGRATSTPDVSRGAGGRRRRPPGCGGRPRPSRPRGGRRR